MDKMHIGDKVIKKEHPIEVNGKITHVDIEFKDGSREVLSAKMIENSRTEQPIDASTLRELQLETLIKEILSLYLDWDIKLMDMHYVNSKVITSLEEWITSANTKLWGKKENSVRMSELDSVLRTK